MPLSSLQNVSRLAKLIDDAKNRTARQQLPPLFVDELDADTSAQVAAKREVLLDALGNVPLKLYDVSFDSIDDIAGASWTPQMHLTDEERKVVEAKGTVLLLGRYFAMIIFMFTFAYTPFSDLVNAFAMRTKGVARVKQVSILDSTN